MRDIASRFREYARLDRKRDAEGLSPAELRRWSDIKRSLGKTFSPNLSDRYADRRGSVRVPARLAVSFGTVGELQRSLMTNLSRGGVFIATNDALEIGARVRLRVVIEETGKTLEISAEVVSQNVGPHFEYDQQGMGVRFLDVDDETREQIDRLYESHLREAVRDKGDD